MTTFKHILVFERQAAMRHLMGEVFEELGFRVTLADHIDHAVRALECDDVDLVIAEVRRPNNGELEVLDRAAALGVTCVLLTDPAKQPTDLSGATIVHKPVTLEQLGKTVIAALSPPDCSDGS